MFIWVIYPPVVRAPGADIQCNDFSAKYSRSNQLERLRKLLDLSQFVLVPGAAASFCLDTFFCLTWSLLGLGLTTDTMACWAAFAASLEVRR